MTWSVVSCSCGVPSSSDWCGARWAFDALSVVATCESTCVTSRERRSIHSVTIVAEAWEGEEEVW